MSFGSLSQSACTKARAARIARLYSSFNQSDHCLWASSLPFSSSLLMLPIAYWYGVQLSFAHALLQNNFKIQRQYEALPFCAWLKERRAPGNPEAGVFLFGLREEQRTRTYDRFILIHAKMKSLLSAPLHECRLLQICEEGKAFWCWKF